MALQAPIMRFSGGFTGGNKMIEQEKEVREEYRELEKAEPLDEITETEEEDLPEKEVSDLVEEEEKTSSDYAQPVQEYDKYRAGIKVYQPPSDDIIVFDDISLHILKKKNDPKEHIKRGKYTRPWESYLANYMKDGQRDRAKRAKEMERRESSSDAYAAAHC